MKVSEEIQRGETLFLEFRLPGEDLTGATPYVLADAGIPTISLVIAKPDMESITVRAADTSNFLLGRHRLQLWIDWPNGDVVAEMLTEVLLTVVEPPEEQ